MEKEFKTHMIRYFDDEGDFTTMCGIGTYSRRMSESFYNSAKISSFGDLQKTTCANCIKRYKKSEKEFFKPKSKAIKCNK